MLAAVIERPGAVTVRQVPAPRAAGLALVRVGVAGICGTDRKLAAGVFPVTAPRELTIRCPRASRPRDFDTAIRLCAGRRLDVTPLVTGRFPLPEAAAALAASEDPAQLKVVLDVAGR